MLKHTHRPEKLVSELLGPGVEAAEDKADGPGHGILLIIGADSKCQH